MRILRIAVFTAVIACSTPGYAGFIWLDNDWDVTLDMNADKGTSSKRRAFGASATMDGQILDTGADIAVARAEALASTDVTGAGNSSFIARVDFDRSFQVSGSPAGWNITLQEVLSGSLATLDPQMFSFASVRATAFINGTDVNDMPVDGPSLVFDEMNNNNVPDILFPVLNQTRTLPDGKYTITGSLMTKGLVFLDPLAGSAQSKFFDGGLAVSLVASPIPEPPSWLLVLTGGFALLAVCVRKYLRTTDESVKWFFQRKGTGHLLEAKLLIWPSRVPDSPKRDERKEPMGPSIPEQATASGPCAVRKGGPARRRGPRRCRASDANKVPDTFGRLSC